MAKENLKMIRIASVYHPHGIKGEVELRLLNDNFDECVLDEGMVVMIQPTSEKSCLPKDGEEITILKLRFGNKVICSLSGIKDRTHLETMLPFDMYVPRESFPETEDDEFYLVDVIEWEVVSPEGAKLGNLESFADNGMQYIFDVRLNDGSILSLPYVDAFFPDINKEDKKIVMIMPEYTE
jgi:16S rRNA processing protein RimM